MVTDYERRAVTHYLICLGAHALDWNSTHTGTGIINPGEEHAYRAEPHRVRCMACAEKKDEQVTWRVERLEDGEYERTFSRPGFIAEMDTRV